MLELYNLFKIVPEFDAAASIAPLIETISNLDSGIRNLDSYKK